MVRRFLLLLAFCLSFGLSFAPCLEASAQTAAPPAAPAHPAANGLTAKQAEQALETLQDPKKRQELIDALQAIAKAGPAAAPAPPKPAAAPALAPNSLGAQLLVQLSGWLDQLGAEASASAKSLTAFPLLWGWLRRVASDPAEGMALLDATWRLGLILAAALLAEYLTAFALRRPTVALIRLAPHDDAINAQPKQEPQAAAPGGEPTRGKGAGGLLHRLPFALVALIADLIPVAVFAGIGNFLSEPVAPTVSSRLISLALVNGYAINAIVLCFGRALVAPHRPNLRLLPLPDTGATYLMRWLRVIAGIAVFGSAAAEIATVLGVDEATHDTFIRLVALVVALLMVLIVIDCRHAVAARIRPEGASSGLALRTGTGRWRLWLAGAWHYLAIVGILLGWVAWSVGVRDGAAGLRYLFGTAAVLIVARITTILALGVLDRVLRIGHPDNGSDANALDDRVAHYYRPARITILTVIAFLTALLLLQVWGLDVFGLFRGGGIGGRLLSALLTIGIAALCAIVVWELANAAIDRRLARLSAASGASRAARLRTLLPILRAALLTAIVAVVGLTALSEIGINIAPLLAGAGIAGVAVGFGSQKLVQDVITGIFVLIENAIQVGDCVTVAGLSGTVEQLSVRNIWLRASEGSVHVIPFSAVTTITNASRGVGNAIISVTVALKEDIDRVTTILCEIATAMRKEPEFSSRMISELQVLGVDSVKATGVTIAAQIVCTDDGRLPVQREFNRRLKQRFQESGIELAA